MAAELGLLSLTQLQNLQQQQQKNLQKPNSSTTGSWMWNPNPSRAAPEDNDSWEVRAFAEDTGNVMGTTWPPRSYTCTFCRREFRSAQALGGHMNVHRRDRARLHQSPAPAGGSGVHHPTTTTSSSPTLIIPTQEFIKSGGVCFLYSLPNPNPNNGALFSPNPINAHIDSPSTLLSISPYPSNNLVNPTNYPPCIDIPVANPSLNSSICHSSNTEPSASIDNENNNSGKEEAMEELDLELRLGCRPSPS